MLGTSYDAQFAHIVDGPGCLTRTSATICVEIFVLVRAEFWVLARRVISESVPLIQFNSGVLLWAKKSGGRPGAGRLYYNAGLCSELVMLGCAANL